MTEALWRRALIFVLKTDDPWEIADGVVFSVLVVIIFQGVTLPRHQMTVETIIGIAVAAQLLFGHLYSPWFTHAKERS